MPFNSFFPRKEHGVEMFEAFGQKNGIDNLREIFQITDLVAWNLVGLFHRTRFQLDDVSLVVRKKRDGDARMWNTTYYSHFVPR